MLAELSEVSEFATGTTVSGVPVLHAVHEGPLSAGLMFRVGRADEPLATAGVTHLVEHLALVGRHEGAFYRNGATDDSVTRFEIMGDEMDVRSFLEGVCRSLSALPLDRLDVEKDLLRLEAMHRENGPADTLRTERYGARGPGAVTYGELGLHELDGEAVQCWANTHFTRGNAVLWVIGPRVPPGLSLDLPDGPRMPVPRWPEVERPRPAYVTGATGIVLIDAVVRRSTASSMFALLATRMLFRSLREEGGISYSPGCGYEVIDGERARISLAADALPENRADVIKGVIDVLMRLRAGDIDEDDVAAAIGDTERVTRHPRLGSALLATWAFDVLTGHPIPNPEQLVREAKNVTAVEIAEIADHVFVDAIACIPDGDLAWAGFAPAPRWSAKALEGYHFPVHGDPQFGLTLSEEGVSIRTPAGASTVRFADCVAYLAWPDGARTLVGADGFRVPIEPTQYFGLSLESILALDERVPAGVTIHLPARSDDEIPPSHGKPMRWRGYGVWAAILGVVFALMLALALPFALGVSSTLSEGPGAAEMQRLAVAGWVVVVVLAALTVLLFAGVRRRGRWVAATGER